MLMAAAGIGRTHGDHMKKDDKLEAMDHLEFI